MRYTGDYNKSAFYPEFVIDGETGYLTELGDIDQTTEALDKLLANRVAAENMGKSAREHIASAWNWDHYVVEILDVYNPRHWSVVTGLIVF